MNVNRLLEYAKSNYGRIYGWDIEFDGRILGSLLKPVQVDLFWVSYILHANSKEDAQLLCNEKLWNECKLNFRNKRNKKYAHDAFSEEVEEIKPGKRINMRGLYIAPKNRFEQFIVSLLSLFVYKNIERQY